jgi:hypothetical protein
MAELFASGATDELAEFVRQDIVDHSAPRRELHQVGRASPRPSSSTRVASLTSTSQPMRCWRLVIAL